MFLEASKRRWVMEIFERERDEGSWKGVVLESLDNYGFDVQTVGTIWCSSNDLTMREKGKCNYVSPRGM
jgi:hypothetical protein